MRKIYPLIGLFFCMAASVYAQESVFDFDSKIEVKKHEKLNESPYAMFGDNTAVLTTDHERDLDHFLKIPLMEGGKQVGMFSLNFQNGMVNIFDMDKNLILEERLSSDKFARFLSIDPHAESYYSTSPYVYCNNNPIKYIDPTGKDWVHRVVDGINEYYYDRNVRSQDDVNSKYGKKGGVTHMASGSSMTRYSKDGSIETQYTFFNDGGEHNEYGAVVDKDGNLMSDDAIIMGNNYTVFGTSDNSANAETLHGNYFGTSYTGPYNPQTYGNETSNIMPKDSYQYMPRNLSERPAIRHDKRYDRQGATGVSGALLDTRVLGADIRLTVGSAAIAVNPLVSRKDRVRAAAVAIGFGNISTGKFLMAIW